MTSVFLSGSRKISRLNDMIRYRIQNMVDQNFEILVGDANGADKAMQNFLAETSYQNVTVFCAGPTCRNNLGDWQVQKVRVSPKLKGRDFYTQKDKEMAAIADYGFVLWDGKSAGSINNVFELLKREKTVVIYLSQKKQFEKITNPQDVKNLLQTCDSADFLAISRKTNMNRRMEDFQLSAQGAFNL
jgi:hypothetical protein